MLCQAVHICTGVPARNVTYVGMLHYPKGYDVV